MTNMEETEAAAEGRVRKSLSPQQVHTMEQGPRDKGTMGENIMEDQVFQIQPAVAERVPWAKSSGNNYGGKGGDGVFKFNHGNSNLLRRRRGWP